jgi:hypothetical protein
MTMSQSATDRRSFLKSGALVAAPVAIVAAPAAALAGHGRHARLARLEDERDIGALHRDLIRQVNRGERKLAKGLSALADDPAHELEIAFAGDARRATCRRACIAGFRTEFTGHSTIEQMHRLQGQGMHEHAESRELVTEYVRGKDGWAIESLRLV